ncbi:hypothetical protein A3Q56_05895 [Intoshia linei]|uniref:AP180 N-terminal homology (ANTH) domain-containing protein n=1 Tax=Intoshia linei TaxID=1819745 RepID=A0A177AWE7_9BILA|nr:hypothetical protein A3Q56_05895 [Intoshia linei]
MSLYQRKKAQFSKKRQILRMKKILTSTYECIKLRHVRHMVESSFEPQGDFEIWSIIILFRKKYNENDVVAWKLVQCLHKLMLHGHSRMRRFNDFRMEEINKLHKIWACVKIGYGPIISVYSKYLCLKASFHYMYNEVDGAFNINDTNLKVMFQNSADFIFEFFEAVARLLNSSIIIMNAILRKSFDISSSFGEYRFITFPIIYFIAEGSSLHRLTLISISELHKIADFSMLEIQRNNAKLLHDRLDIILCKARTEIPTLTTNWRELKLSTPAEFFKDATHHYDEESDDTVENNIPESPESQELPELELYL